MKMKMNYENMWNSMKSTHETRLSELESKGKKGGNDWTNAKRVVEVMIAFELSEQEKHSKNDGIND